MTMEFHPVQTKTLGLQRRGTLCHRRAGYPERVIFAFWGPCHPRVAWGTLIVPGTGSTVVRKKTVVFCPRRGRERRVAPCRRRVGGVPFKDAMFLLAVHFLGDHRVTPVSPPCRLGYPEPVWHRIQSYAYKTQRVAYTGCNHCCHEP